MIEPDTCDRCGPSVVAYFFVEMESGLLTYCGHHGTLYEDEILAQGGQVILDVRYMIGG